MTHCRFNTVVLGAIAWLTMGAPAMAQQTLCEEAVANAVRLYTMGQFQETILTLESCRVSPQAGFARLGRADKATLYSLLAKSFVAEFEFDQAEASVRELILQNPEFISARTDPPLFADMVDRARRGLVRSVSKFAEDWREAPGTVAVVTADEIARRGYRDVEAVLHDLPGFDIARGNGDLYANVYQRGYRSNATDRTLVLVDGIEQNDLHSNIAYISRQYPLSDIARIEIVYGPASTIYGPNAFSGVINIITNDPDAMIGPARAHAGRVHAFAGAFGTTAIDGTYAGKTRDDTVSWAVTSRVFRSSEPDLSKEPAWQFGYPQAFDRVPYSAILQLEGKTLDKFLCRRLADGASGSVFEHPERCAEPTAEAPDVLRTITEGLTEARDVNGDGLAEIVPTALGIQRARALDRALWNSRLNGRAFAFSDPTRDWFFATKVKFSDFTLGVQTWRANEGTAPWYLDWAHGDGGTWVPRQTAIFASYARPVNSNLALNVLVRYKNDQIDDESRIPLMGTYANGYLSVLDLLAQTAPQFATFKADQVSTQFRTEVTGVYQRSESLRAIVGADIRDGSSQAGYFLEADAPFFSFESEASPQEIKATDVGIFGQGSYTWRRTLKTVLGLRYDGNEVRENERVSVRDAGTQSQALTPVSDFGKFFSPRAAVVATLGGRNNQYLTGVPGRLIVKGIYSRASQQPANFQRFASEPYIREFPSPFLGREKAVNTEVSVGWEPNDGTRLEVARYVVNYSDVLQTALKVDPCCIPATTGQFQSVGGFRVAGLQATASGRWRQYGLYANYTYTEGLNSERLKDAYGEDLAVDGQSVGRLPIGDVARHKLNLGGTFTARNRFDVSLRLNAVGRRPTGAATTSRLNGQDVPGYATVHTAVAYRDEQRGMTLQLSIDNLFNARYWDPGVRSAQVLGFAGRIPQPGVNAVAHLILDLNFAAPRD